MAIDDLAIRFSDQMYATRREVSETLHIGTIDSIWNRILAYRSQFAEKLSVRNVDKIPYTLVTTPSCSAKLNRLERKLTKILLRYEKMGKNSYSHQQFREKYAEESIRFVARKYQVEENSAFLRSLFSDSSLTLSAQELVLYKYAQCLQFMERYVSEPLDENYLKQLYAKLTGKDVLQVSFRNHEIDGNSRALIDRIDKHAPLSRLEEMLKTLFDFVRDCDVSMIQKAVVGYYSIRFIQPFDSYSEELAVLYAKAILGHENCESLAALFPLESLLLDDFSLEKVFLEVEKGKDMTYLVSYLFPLFENIAENMLEDLSTFDASEIQEEFYKKEESEEHQEVEPVKEVQKQEKKEEISSLDGAVDYELRVALPVLPVGVGEKEAERIQQHLLELHPSLHKGEAYFYARHCTLGKYYTIAQYKAALSCAYETARTSMDALVREGFYSKELIKNKYVYTPVKRK